MSRHVLVVDDEPDIRELATFALGRIGGLAVSSASDGASALQLAQGQLFDAIMLDVMMPGMGGIETATLLRSNPRTQSVPIVLLTARSASDGELVGAPVDGILAKPFDPVTLADQLAATLRWKR